MIKTNDLKKGTPITLRNGWAAILMDNMKGMTRLAEVVGLYTEIGSIYAHDIAEAYIDGKWVPVELTKKQKQLMEIVS